MTTQSYGWKPQRLQHSRNEITLKVIPPLQAFSSAIRRTFVQYFTRFQLTARSRGPSATAGLLVFISEVAQLWEKDYCDAVRVVERGRELQFAEQFSSDEDVTPAGRHSAHRLSYSMHTAHPVDVLHLAIHVLH